MDKVFAVVAGAVRACLGSSQRCSQVISGWGCSMLGGSSAGGWHLIVTMLKGPRAGPWQLSHAMMAMTAYYLVILLQGLS